MKRKVAIIHDWLNGMRGGEKVLEEILDLFPEADIYTLFLEKEKISEKIREHTIIPSSLNKFPFIRKHYKHFLPFFPSTIEHFNLTAYDLIISISHCAAKGIIPGPDTLHISYVNSPMRYIWDQYYSYFGKTKGIKKWFIQRQTAKLRVWDAASSARVDYFIANSEFIKKRIRKYYRRKAAVIHPPVDTDFYRPTPNPKRDYFLTVCALVPYKGTDLLVDAFNRSGDKLIIVGKGPEEKNLKRMAAKNIIFKSNLPAIELRELYQHATAFVYAGIEDFGICFVEANACGTPVVAYKRGGVLDIVDENSGIFFEEQTPEHIAAALNKIKKKDFQTSIIRKNSLKFSRESFKKKIDDYINSKIQ